MTQKEETLTVAKSTIIFKTTDEWFKTLVSGVVETFFPDKELTFSIEIKKRKNGAYGTCFWFEAPSRIFINSWYHMDGIETAEVIAHEIIHVFAKGLHGADFQKEAAKAGLIMLYKNGFTQPTQDFAEKISPVLKRLEKEYPNIFPDRTKNISDVFFLIRKKRGEWLAYPEYSTGNSEKVQIRQKALRLAVDLEISEQIDKKIFPIEYRDWESSVFKNIRKIDLEKLNEGKKFCLLKNTEGDWISLPETNDTGKAAARQKVVRAIAALETAFPAKKRTKHPFFTVSALCSNKELFGNLLSVYYPRVSDFFKNRRSFAEKEQPALPLETVVALRGALNASFQEAAALDLETLKKLIGLIERKTKKENEPVGQAELELKGNERRKERSEKFFIRRADERYADVKSDRRWKSFPEKLRVIRKYFPDWC